MWNSPLPAPALEPAVFMMRVGIFSVINFSFSSRISACSAKVAGVSLCVAELWAMAGWGLCMMPALSVQKHLCAPMLVRGYCLMCMVLGELWPARAHQGQQPVPALLAVPLTPVHSRGALSISGSIRLLIGRLHISREHAALQMQQCSRDLTSFTRLSYSSCVSSSAPRTATIAPASLLAVLGALYSCKAMLLCNLKVCV